MKNRKTFAVIAAEAAISDARIRGHDAPKYSYFAFLFILKDIAHFYPAQSIIPKVSDVELSQSFYKHITPPE